METGGVRLLRLLGEKENVCLVSSSVDPEDIKNYVWGPSGTLTRNMGSTELTADYGAQRARYIRRRCIGTVRT